MLSHAHKRLRHDDETGVRESPSDPALRSALANRAAEDDLPGTWRAIAAPAGVSSADAHLGHLGRSILEALQVVAVTAEAARVQLRSTRAALLSAVDSRCDELEERITSTESAKVAALERELCAVDAVLERLRAERGAAAKAAESLNDDDLSVRHAELAARLDDAEAQLLGLATAVIEPPYVGLIADALALLTEIAAFGRVVVPRAITAADLTLDGAPTYSQSGRITLRLVIRGDRHANQSSEELEVALVAAAAATRIDASLQAAGAAKQHLTADINADACARCLIISFLTPLAASAGASAVVDSVTVFGRPIATTSLAGPLTFPLRRSMQTLLCLKWPIGFCCPDSFTVSSGLQIFVPESGSPAVLVFDCDGSQLPGIPVAALGLSSKVRWTAFSNADDPALLLADDCGASSRVVAVDPTLRDVRWATAPGLLQGCNGLAVLPRHNVFIVASATDRMLFAHRLLDGARVGTLRASQCFGYLAADPATGTVFGTVKLITGRFSVGCYSWTPVGGLRAGVFVATADKRSAVRPLCVVPPAPGMRTSYLVVGTQSAPDLLVLTLPGLALLHTHKLKGMEVIGLTADPWGETLAVYNAASDSIHILAWPLPGMPALE